MERKFFNGTHPFTKRGLCSEKKNPTQIKKKTEKQDYAKRCENLGKHMKTSNVKKKRQQQENKQSCTN